MFFRYNLFTLLWVIVIFILILIPGQDLPEFSFDKLAHLAVFTILTFLMIIGFSKQSTFYTLKKSPVKYSLMCSGIYASALELGQALIPDRYANFYDLVFNIAGVCLGYLVFILIYKFSFL